MNDQRHWPEGHDTDPRYPDAPAPGTSWGGEYDNDATAFVQLPEELTQAQGPGDPLAAPGHGYRPPEIGTAAGPFPPGGPSAVTPAPAAGDPSSTGSWELPFGTGQPPAPVYDPAPAPLTGGEPATTTQNAAASCTSAVTTS
ncbi:hypothetical protein [Streptomyces sp. SM14]|uniref:hypothetical protein n=1 Tax=Streptomyces sp. SM14 TaxID=1736045 RepID=UPI000CD5432A